MITLIDAFGKQNLNLLRYFNVHESRYAKFSSAKGLNLTVYAVFEALESREKAKKLTVKASE